MMNNKKKTWKTYIEDLLSMNRLVTFATISENIPWSSPMYFTYERNLSIYVLLDTATQHMKNLIFLPKASITLQDINTDAQIQLIGNVDIFSKKDIKMIQEQYNHLSLLHSGDIEFLTHTSRLDWRIVRFTPKRAFLFSQTNESDKQEIHLTDMLSTYITN